MKKLFILITFIFSFSLYATTVTPVAAGLSAAIGQVYNAANNSIYFVEWNSGELSRLNLNTHAITVIESGLTNPEALTIMSGTNLAFVTTRDGKLWRINLAGGKTLIATGLGAAHSIVIDPTKTFAYITDFDGGHLWRVQLATGVVVPRLSGLTHPLGLLMSDDFKTAYISEQETNRIISIDLNTNFRTVLASGLVNPFFMEWTDNSKSAMYFVERDPKNKLSRLDISSSPAILQNIATVPERPSSVVRTLNPDIVYVASDSIISKVQLSNNGGPIITRLGFIPSTSINFITGLGTTDPSYFFRVKNTSFGGSVHIMLNFPGMRNMGATYYKITEDDKPLSAAMKESWTNYLWNGTTFILDTILPSSTGAYSIPGAGVLYATPDLGFIWNTTKLSNIRHTLKVHLFNSRGAEIATGIVAAMIDNEAPHFEINQISHDGAVLNECALITSGSPNLTFNITAYDHQGHLLNYALTDRWGHGQSHLVTADNYIGAHDASIMWPGIFGTVVNYTLLNTACSHSFVLSGYGNTTNGFGMIHYSEDYNHLAIYLGGNTCQ